MVKKMVKYSKFVLCIALILSLVAPSYAALSASDGSAFVTKAEFDSALADFNARLTTFEAGINSKIDSQVTSYLDRNGIWNGKEQQIRDEVKYGLCVMNLPFATEQQDVDFNIVLPKIVVSGDGDYWPAQTAALRTGVKGIIRKGKKIRASHAVTTINKSGLVVMGISYLFETWCSASSFANNPEKSFVAYYNTLDQTDKLSYSNFSILDYVDGSYAYSAAYAVTSGGGMAAAWYQLGLDLILLNSSGTRIAETFILKDTNGSAGTSAKAGDFCAFTTHSRGYFLKTFFASKGDDLSIDLFQNAQSRHDTVAWVLDQNSNAYDYILRVDECKVY